MSQKQATIDFLRRQCARYPALCPQDLLKGLHQSVFGCGHFVSDEERGICRIQEEAATLPGDGDALPELLDGAFCRLPLQYLQEKGMTPRTLFRLFALSAKAPVGTAELLSEKVDILLALARDGQLPVSYAETAQAAETFRREGFPACHHSEAFRNAYHPAYRVISREFLWILPLLAGIDRKMAEQSQVLVALEGCCASGKTTLAGLLEQIYDCNVFHMDDFFLRPEQRTPERYAQPGGNVDRERFLEEVLRPLGQGLPVRYRRYDCQTQSLLAPAETAPKALTVVEGAYSLHPDLADAYDLSAVLRISPALQRARIEKRNTPEMQERFFSRWIPLEQAYFTEMDPAGRCDMILEVEA
ncbi:hypothetical protein [Oscillibacter sp.]|uniref:hypothetical protein n=1 Tax=Oscillibacter sp. TaxID=1945593 RepID=UPI00262CF204|nr:hypothetical protein [Oscillibacter sp.]MDD3346136.1 hypothetical protein [Oscillibacter sp.]